MTPHDLAMASLRRRCEELHQQLGRDAMLRQNDPVETLFAFARGLIDEQAYIIGWNHWQGRMAALLDEYEAAFPNRPHIGTRVQAPKDGKLVSMPEFLLNHRWPDHAAIAELRPAASKEASNAK